MLKVGVHAPVPSVLLASVHLQCCKLYYRDMLRCAESFFHVAVDRLDPGKILIRHPSDMVSLWRCMERLSSQQQPTCRVTRRR